MTPNTQTFVYPQHQLGAAFDEHMLDAHGTPDANTEYLVRQREHGEPASGYRPAMYVPSVDRLIVVIDRSFADAGDAKAYIACRMLGLLKMHRQQQHPTQEIDECAI